MRRILAEHARAHAAAKRGGGVRPVPLEERHGEIAVDDFGLAEIAAVDEALDRLAEFDPRAAKVVVLRYFGGLSHEEAARALAVSGCHGQARLDGGAGLAAARARRDVTAPRWEAVKAELGELLDLPEERRAAERLARLGAGDPELAREVESLLAQGAGDASFLERPASERWAPAEALSAPRGRCPPHRSGSAPGGSRPRSAAAAWGASIAAAATTAPSSRRWRSRSCARAAHRSSCAAGSSRAPDPRRARPSRTSRA